jgi:hypothetical protein
MRREPQHVATIRYVGASAVKTAVTASATPTL